MRIKGRVSWEVEGGIFNVLVKKVEFGSQFVDGLNVK